MLNPLVQIKVIRAKNALLAASGRLETEAAKDHLLNIAGDRRDFYLDRGKWEKADRILELATEKKRATPEGRKRLSEVRQLLCGNPLERKLAGTALAETIIEREKADSLSA